MPLYSARCSNGHPSTFYSRIDDRDNSRQCGACGANLYRMLEAPTVHAGMTPYQSPVSGEWIDSASARRNDLQRNGCVEWEPGMRQDLPRLRAAAEEKSMAVIDAAVEQTARDLISAGKLDPL